MTKVKLISNHCLGDNGGAVYIEPLEDVYDAYNFYLYVADCEFRSNVSPGHGAALYVYGSISNSSVHIVNTIFDNNIAGSSIVYIAEVRSFTSVQLVASSFTNNVATSMYIPACNVHLLGNVIFRNNRGDNGAALYLSQGTTVNITREASVQFIANSATQNGGAIYIDLIFNNQDNTFLIDNSYINVSFTNNSAGIAGNSLYFNIPKSYELNENTMDKHIMYAPCLFNYFQLVNGTLIHIPCNFSYILLNGTGSPIVTSPHELRLYFPNNDGVNISSNSDHNIYYIKNNILGHEVKFNGATFDYFGKPSVPSQFSVECVNCSTVSLFGDNHLLVDNITNLSVRFKGGNIEGNNTSVTLNLISTLYSLQQISTTLVVELLPCTNHPGNKYNNLTQTCVCYHHDVVECHDTYNEIKRGYWFGSVKVGETLRATTSLCPNHYCNFVDRNETREGYFKLPRTINGQCKKNRSGSACGMCNSNYTLAYDSTDCVSVDHCNTGMTVLVVVLTCLYWIVVVVGVFSLMYFNFQISSGYVYGIIYYYSMVGILLDNNPYISDGVFQFFSVLSSFAQLSPQFLGQLCFVTGLSGIDQLFIHYSHAVAVSILTLVIVLAARCSVRVTVLVSRCVIRVICLLLLLSYMSLASTSLQLLRPLKFTDVNEVYTYASPHIGYFHGHHAIYGIVAVICELVVGIGLPLLLLLEPLLSRKINFIKIKPLLDQFQGCYKDKYRWFVAYYLICRQVIMLIVFVGNSNYYNMLFYLQTTLVVIAMIHMWAQPYQDESLNALDGLILLVMVLVVNINTFLFLQNVTTELSIFLVVLPIFLFCSIAVQKLVRSCVKKKRYPLYGQLDNICNDNNDKIAEENALR